MIHLWEYDSRKINGVNMPQMMGDLERIGNEGWELVFIKEDIDEEGRVTAIFKRERMKLSPFKMWTQLLNEFLFYFKIHKLFNLN